MRNSSIIVGLVVSILVVFVSSVQAGPSISNVVGEVSSDSTLTINGSDFTTGPTVYKWDNFEGDTHVVGQMIGSGPSGQIAWSQYNPTEPAGYVNTYVVNTGNRQGSSQFVSAKLGMGVGKSTSVFEWINSFETPHLFLSMYQRCSKIAGGQTNQKFWRFAGGPWAATLPYVRYISNVDTERKLNRGDSTTVSAVNYVDVPLNNHWVKVEMYGESSDPGVANGLIHFASQHQTNGEFILSNQDNIATRDGLNNWKAIVFENYVVSTTNDTEYHHDYDDIYIADSRARVEIGDASTWAACTRREVQTPTAWSDNSVDFTFNQGSFSPGDHVYVFVVDDNGVPSAGRGPITVGGTVEQTPVPLPQAVQGFKLN